MTRQEIIKQIKNYFNIKELVCPHIYKRFGETAWMFLSTQLLHTILVIRQDILNKPMIVNNSSTYTQRGMRCNMCQIVKGKTSPYLSAHVTGNAIDFSCSDLSAEQIRQSISQHKDELPYNIRLEKDVNWVHVDVYDNLSNNKIEYFTA